MKTPRTNKAIGKFMQQTRTGSCYTLRGVAKRTGIDYAVLARMEKGTFRMSLPVAVTLCRFYRVPLDTIESFVVYNKEGRLI